MNNKKKMPLTETEMREVGTEYHKKKENEDLQQNILKKSIDFMRSWMETNWDLTLSLTPEVRWAGTKQVNVEFEVNNVGRNILFDMFMETIKAGYRMSKNEHGTFIWSVEVNFNFKDGGHNGWTYRRNFVLKNDNFIEKVR